MYYNNFSTVLCCAFSMAGFCLINTSQKTQHHSTLGVCLLQTLYLFLFALKSTPRGVQAFGGFVSLKKEEKKETALFSVSIAPELSDSHVLAI